MTAIQVNASVNSNRIPVTSSHSVIPADARNPINRANNLSHLPQDFEEHKEEYFQALKAPLDVEPFISDIIQLMKDKLYLLNQGFEDKSNDKVAITSRNNKGWIRVTPLEKRPNLHICL